MLQRLTIPVTPFMQNCSLIWCDQTKEAAFIDPGGETDRLLEAIQEKNLQLKSILLTHGHLDHVGGVSELIKHQVELKIIGPHHEDEFWIQGLEQQAQRFGFPPADSFKPHQWLQHGDTVTVGHENLSVYHCPGHTPGHVIFLHTKQKIAFVGDVLFNGSVGRSDFPKGNHQTLINSIKNILLPLGDEIQFVPGHGPESTFGHEKRTNPFLI